MKIEKKLNRQKVRNTIIIKNVIRMARNAEESLQAVSDPNTITESYFCPPTITDEYGRELELLCLADEKGKTVHYYKFSGNY